MPTITDVFQGAGAFSVPFKSEIESAVTLKKNDYHIAFRWGAELIAQGPIVTVIRGDKVVVEGHLMPYWLGIDNEGYPVDYLRACSGANKLSNGDFELGSLYWRPVAENSKVHIDGTEIISGTKSARWDEDRQDDDVLQSEESWPVQPGDVMRLSADLLHEGAAEGNHRLRVIASGRFDHPNLDEDGGFDVSSKWEEGDAPDMEVMNDAGNAYSGTGVLRIGPMRRDQFLDDTDFEAGFGAWDDFNEVEVSTERAHSGTNSIKFKAGGADTAAIQQSFTGMKSGDSFRARMHLSSADCDVPIVLRILYKDTNAEFQTINVISQEHFKGDEDGWYRLSGDFTLSDMDETVDPVCIVALDDIAATGGAWFVDNVEIYRIEGNIQGVSWKNRDLGTDQNVPIIPHERYRLSMKVRSDGVTQGEIFARAAVSKTLLGAEENIDGPLQGATDGDWTKYEWDFEAPSGYDRLQLRIFGKDVLGGSFYVDKVEIRFADETSYIRDKQTAPGEAATVFNQTFDVTMPEGAESVRIETLVETDGAGWRMDNVSFLRVCTPDEAADIVTDLISGTGLSAGEINDMGTILFDWEIYNRTVRQALDELLTTGLVQPAREWNVRPGGQVDVGTAAEIFDDRTDVLLRKNDCYVIGTPDARDSEEHFVKRVKLIGQERRRTNGQEYVVTGEATNAVGTRSLFDGSAFTRTRYVEDGSVDHRGAAEGLAETIAAEAADPSPSHQLQISDWKTLAAAGRAGFAVGDYIYVWLPDQNIESSSYPMDWEGEKAWPDRLRVLERTWTLGDRGLFKVILRRNEDDEIDISEYVDWESVGPTSAQITVGKLRPTFVTNPQGGGLARQWERYRKAVGDA